MSDTVPTYDVFLSYNWREHAAVEAIARALRDRELRVFLDRWYLVPGRPWPQALEGSLDSRSRLPWPPRDGSVAAARERPGS